MEIGGTSYVTSAELKKLREGPTPFMILFVILIYVIIV
jgi:hypothetical protein